MVVGRRATAHTLSFRAQRGISFLRIAEIPHCVRDDSAWLLRWAAFLLVAGAVTACGTARPPVAPTSAPAASAPASAPATRGGGYYQDDGPPAQVPPDLAKVPDAVPKVEPPHRFANRPYVALGRNYTPLAGDPALRQRGLASWYGRQFHGNRTSSGELYDMFAMTAAHPTMPIPSYARVTNLRSGASVVVRVNDRGPFKDDRIIDLSYAAATRLGYIGTGTAEVEVERLTNADIAAGRCCGRGVPASQVAAPTAPPGVAPTAPAAANPAAATAAASQGVPPAGRPAAPLPPVVRPVSPPLPAPAETSAAVPVPGTTTQVTQAPVTTAPGNAPPATEGAAASAGASASVARWSVQVGAFSQAANAQALRERVAVQLEQSSEPDLAAAWRSPRVEQDGAVFRVLVGALPDRATALQLAARLERLLARETTLLLR